MYKIITSKTLVIRLLITISHVSMQAWASSGGIWVSLEEEPSWWCLGQQDRTGSSQDTQLQQGHQLLRRCTQVGQPACHEVHMFMKLLYSEKLWRKGSQLLLVNLNLAIWILSAVCEMVCGSLVQFHIPWLCYWILFYKHLVYMYIGVTWQNCTSSWSIMTELNVCWTLVWNMLKVRIIIFIEHKIKFCCTVPT